MMRWWKINVDFERNLFWIAAHTSILIHTLGSNIKKFVKKIDEIDEKDRSDGEKVQNGDVIREGEG